MNSSSLSQVLSIMQPVPMMVQNKVNGMTTYKTVYDFAYECVLVHAIYDVDYNQYILDVSDLPDFTRHQFASLLMKYEPGYINESCGADNSRFDSDMVPALLNFLKDSTNQDKQIAFAEIWRDCTTSYLTGVMQDFIDKALSEYNRG